MRSLTDRRTMSVGTACSGSDVVMHALAALSAEWQHTFNKSVRFSHAFAVEKDEAKQGFLVRNFPELRVLFADIEELLCLLMGDYGPCLERQRLISTNQKTHRSL
jgi:hypothetical protein